MYDVYAMHETALARYLDDLEAARVLMLENPKAFNPMDPDDEDDDYSVADGVATLSITGPLMGTVPKWYGIYGIQATGYGDIIKSLAKAEADPSVTSVQLNINSPGGEVHGADDVWTTIRNLSKTKPVQAVNTGMIASAAYYIASACDQIHASAPTNETGSIGVVIAGYDTSKADEKYGVRKVAIYSKNAPNKASAFDTEHGRQLLQDRADAFERIFHSRVAEGRGVDASDVTDKFGAGGIFVAADPDKSKPNAVQMGLIDSVGVNNWVPIVRKAAPSVFGASQVSPPASAGNLKPEDSMNLIDFLASNPDAKAAFDKFGAEQFAKGENAAKLRAEKVGKILASDAYKSNSVVQAKALEALAGSISLETFDNLVAMADMLAEQAKLTASAPGKETAPAVIGGSLSADSVAKMSRDQLDKLTAADFAAMSPEVALAVEKRQTELLQGGN